MTRILLIISSRIKYEADDSIGVDARRSRTVVGCYKLCREEGDCDKSLSISSNFIFHTDGRETPLLLYHLCLGPVQFVPSSAETFST